MSFATLFRAMRRAPAFAAGHGHFRPEQLECRRLLSAATSYVPGELLVGFRPGAGDADIARFYARHGVAEREALDRHARPGDARLKLVSVPAGQAEKLAAQMARDPRVAYAEPNYLFDAGAATPTDPTYIGQWALKNTGQWNSTPDADIDAPEAWDVTTGSPDVVVAVIDTGVDYNHPDLVANMWTNPFETAGDGVDNDGNGYVDDVHGISAVDGSGDPSDRSTTFPGHGTAVAGIIGGTPYNEGTVGIAQRVSIIAVNVFPLKGGASVSDIVRGFHYLNYLKNVQGVNVVATNNSYGSVDRGTSRSSRALKEAMAGVDQPGMRPILHVCAAMNDNADNDAVQATPAGFDLDNIVSVAATDWDDLYADFSNYGATTVDLAAPGAPPVQTTAPGGSYNYVFSGTSAASPHVAGAAALVWSAFPGLSAAQVKQRILAGVDPIGHLGNNASKPTVTNGRLNIAKALAGAAAENDARAPAPVSTLAATGDYASVTLHWTATGDDGTAGRAAFYDIRYSTSPVTRGNWDDATRALGERGPAAASSAEQFTVGGLEPGATYYFAIKVRDGAGNESALSTVAAATTAPAATVFTDSMENGANGWTGSGLWHQTSHRSSSAGTSWYYGVDATRTYDTGAANSGMLTSPVIDLRNVSRPVLVYREWRQVEDIPGLDRATVQVGTSARNWSTVSMSDFSTSIDPVNWGPRAEAEFGWAGEIDTRFGTPRWVSRAVDLSAFAGQSVRVRFAFDTVEGNINAFEGWYVDDVNVYAAVAPAAPAVGVFSASRIPAAPYESAWSRLEPLPRDGVLDLT